MLSFPELAALGFCPNTKYGWMKPFPPGFELPTHCSLELFPQLPLQIQVFYETLADNGQHKLKCQLR